MNFFVLSALFNLITSVVLGIFVFFKNIRRSINKSYGLLSLSIAFWSISYVIWQISKSYSEAFFWVRILSIGAIFIPICYLNFILCLLAQQKQKKRIIVSGFIVGCILTSLVFSRLFISGLTKKLFFPYWPDPGFLYSFFLIFFFVCTFYAIYLMIMRLRTSIESEYHHHQIRYVLIASILGFLGGSTNYLLWYNIPVPPLLNFLVGLHVLILAYAIIKYQLMDIETVIHKTVAWFFTYLILLTPFAALTYFTHPWYSRLSDVGIITYVCSMTLLFIYLVRTFQPKIDHLFQRRLYNLEEISNRFVSEATHLRGIAKLTERLEDTIRDTLYTQWVDIFIQEKEGGHYRLMNIKEDVSRIPDLWSDKPFLKWLVKYDKVVGKEAVEIDPVFSAIKNEAKKYFTLTGAMVVVPLILNERLLGIINLGKKANLRRYSAADFNFLTNLKNQSAIAISNSLLYENIEEQVRQRTKELVEVQKQLIQAEKLATVGTLAGGVAHEINNPLAAILTNAQMLLSSEGNFDIAEARESLEMIEEATKRCREIVKKLMTYAKKPLETAVVSKVDVGQALEKAIGFLHYQLEQENIKIITDIGQENCYIIGNHNELEQVFTNIILNGRDAIKKKGAAGNIYISLNQNEDTVQITTRDEGTGIPEDILAKIFDPFFTTKDVGKGLGLGLSICQSIIDKHKGTISVKSKPGKGSTFTIKLPKATVSSGIE